MEEKESDLELDIKMQSQSILSQGIQDLSTMDKSDVSKNLFGQIAWEEILRSGVFLEHKEVRILLLFCSYPLLFLQYESMSFFF